MASDIQELRRQATSGARWSGFSSGMRIATQFAQLAVLARLLSPEDFGLMAMMNVVIIFGQAFGDVGISYAIIHYQDASRKELSSLYWLNIMAGIVVFWLVWMLTPFIARLYSEPRLKDLMVWAALVFLITPFGLQFQVLLEKELRFKRLAIIEVSAVVTAATIGIISACLGQGVFSLIWLVLVQALVKAASLCATGWRTWRPAFRFSWNDCGRFLRFGLFQIGDRGINILGQQLDKLLIGIFLGAQLLGFYSVAYNLMARLYQLINPIFTRVALPVFARVQTDDDRLQKGFLEMISTIAAILIPIYALMIALAEPIIHLLLGSGWEPSIALLQILCILGIIYCIGDPLGSLLLAKGRADIAFYMNLLRTPLYGIAIWIGAREGLIGIAWALVIVTVGLFVPLGFWIRWLLIRMRPGVYLRTLLPFLEFSGLMGIVVYMLSTWIPWPSTPVNFIVCLLAGAGMYAIMMIRWQREHIRRLWEMIRT